MCRGLSPPPPLLPCQPGCALPGDSQRQLHFQPTHWFTLPYASSFDKLDFLISSKQSLLILGNYETERCRKFKNNVYIHDTSVHFLPLLFSFDFRVFWGDEVGVVLLFIFFCKMGLSSLYSFVSGFSHLKYCDNYHIKDF